MALTAHDKSIVRRTARELRDAYDRGEEDSLSETVMLSEGYADVHIYPDDRDNVAHVVRAFKRTVRVPMGGRLKTGAKRKAGSKTSARKRVPSKRVANPRGTPKDADSLYRIRLAPLNAGGYDRFGEYFGRGAPLYVVTTPDGDDLYVRSSHGREAAMENFREAYKHHHGGKHRAARFFGERKAVHAFPAQSELRPWRVTLAWQRGLYQPDEEVHEFVSAVDSHEAMKAARRQRGGGRVVAIRPLDIYPLASH